MSLTTNTTSGTTTQDADAKNFLDSFLNGIVQTGVQAGAQALGIDPRIAGQTVSQVLNMFGIGKDFQTQVTADQAKAQLQQVLSPHLSDPAFSQALTSWLQAAVEPVQAQKAGKQYRPDMSKDWLSDIGDAFSSVNWGQVAQVGMQALPFVLSLI